jgi:hypothetical protein
MASNKYETKVLKSPSIITIQKNEHEKKVKTLTATKEIEKISINELKQKMLNLNDYKNSEIMESIILKEVNIELLSHPNAVEIKKNCNFQKEKINLIKIDKNQKEIENQREIEIQKEIENQREIESQKEIRNQTEIKEQPKSIKKFFTNLKNLFHRKNKTSSEDVANVDDAALETSLIQNLNPLLIEREKKILNQNPRQYPNQSPRQQPGQNQISNQRPRQQPGQNQISNQRPKQQPGQNQISNQRPRQQPGQNQISNQLPRQSSNRRTPNDQHTGNDQKSLNNKESDNLDEIINEPDENEDNGNDGAESNNYNKYESNDYAEADAEGYGEDGDYPDGNHNDEDFLDGGYCYQENEFDLK